MFALSDTLRSCGTAVPGYWNVTFLHLITGFSRDLHTAHAQRCELVSFAGDELEWRQIGGWQSRGAAT
jgi:hypothetical protein